MSIKEIHLCDFCNSHRWSDFGDVCYQCANAFRNPISALQTELYKQMDEKVGQYKEKAREIVKDMMLEAKNKLMREKCGEK